MKLLTKHTDYAIRALIGLAINKGEYISARIIAREHGLPYHFLRTIVQKLIKHKLVASKEGINGGLMIIKDPASIRVIDVINIFQGELELSDCMFRRKVCGNRGTCVLRKEIQRIESLVENEFGNLTIKGLINKMKLNKRGGR